MVEVLFGLDGESYRVMRTDGEVRHRRYARQTCNMRRGTGVPRGLGFVQGGDATDGVDEVWLGAV